MILAGWYIENFKNKENYLKLQKLNLKLLSIFFN